jgi:hypothetical protein
MSTQPTGILNRCAPIGWRPLRDDDETREMAAGAMADDLLAWLERATGRTWERDRVLFMLLESSPAGTDLDGYSLARNLEKFGIEPDTDLVEILDGWSEMLEAAARKREQAAAARLGLEAPFGTSAAARFHAPDGASVAGTAFRIPGDRLGRCAFVSDEGALDKANGELCVLSVGLEDVEIIGPARPSSASLHVAALAAVDAYENQEMIERLGRQADLDIGMFNADVTGMVAAREAAGATTLTAHLELISHLVESSQEAMEDGDLHRTWVAALLCAAAARRVAMLSGNVPDAAAVVDVVADLSAPTGDDDAGSLAVRLPPPAIRLLH